MYVHLMTQEPKRPRRRGVPFTLYLSRKQAEDLDLVSRTRHVPKAELMRLALDRFLADLEGGQLDLPLGIEEAKPS